MFAVVLVPDFALQAVLRFEPDSRHRPVALVDPTSPKPDLIQLTSAARVCGVVEGLTASQAIARCANLIIKPRSAVQEKAATDALLQIAYAFSPNIEATAPGVCTMELMRLNGKPFWRLHVWKWYWKTVLDGSRANECVTDRKIPSPSRSQRRKGRYVDSKAVTAES